MIVGLGLDFVDLDRFAAVVARHGDALVRRICRPHEARPGSGRPQAVHLAGLFAAKEAAMKALGTGWAAGVGFRQIEIVRDPSGAPALHLHDEADRRARALGANRFHLSISHDGASAAAVVILEKIVDEERP